MALHAHTTRLAYDVTCSYTVDPRLSGPSAPRLYPASLQSECAN